MPEGFGGDEAVCTHLDMAREALLQVTGTFADHRGFKLCAMRGNLSRKEGNGNKAVLGCWDGDLIYITAEWACFSGCCCRRRSKWCDCECDRALQLTRIRKLQTTLCRMQYGGPLVNAIQMGSNCAKVEYLHEQLPSNVQLPTFARARHCASLEQGVKPICSSTHHCRCSQALFTLS
jgi:hypothetical protein